MKLVPKMLAKHKGYSIIFRHPFQKGAVYSKGLGTCDENTAKAICIDIVALCEKPSLRQEPTKLLAYARRAVEIVYGEKLAEKVFGEKEKPSFDEESKNIVKIGGVAIHLVKSKDDLRPAIREPARQMLIRRGFNPDEVTLNDFEKLFLSLLAGYVPVQMRQLEERVAFLEKRVKVLEPENFDLREENARLKLHYNVNVKGKIGEAFELWKPVYQEGCSERNHHGAVMAITSFIKTLHKGKDTPIRDITASEIDAWIEKMRGEDEEITLSPLTKRKRRNWVGVFLRWVTSRYKLNENPMNKVNSIAGVAKVPEHIKAIRRFDELKTLIDSLKEHPYWQTWVAVACLSGPRYTEQAYLKLADVYIGDGDYIRITSRTNGRKVIGTKTGRERNIPIEKSILMPLLKTHVAKRLADQINPDATVNAKSPWLFPSIVDTGTVMRTKTPVGLWSHNRSFLRNWQNTVKVVTEKLKEKDENAIVPEYWSYGPDEWRHTFGTVLGNCGWGSLEISRVMGNSPAVAESHYIQSASKGITTRWPLQF